MMRTGTWTRSALASQVLGPVAPTEVSVPNLGNGALFKFNAAPVVTPLGLGTLVVMALSALLIAGARIDR
jgi:hypothetical protein